MSPAPRSLVWEVTARCSLACGHCYNVWHCAGKAAPRELSAADRLLIVRRLMPLGRALRAVTLSGGEPLLLPDLDPLIAALRRVLPGVQINVATNGLLLTPGRARELRRAGADAVQLTLLAARPEIHDSMVGQQGAQMMVLAALAAAREAGLKVASFFVATRRNIDEWPGAAKLALALGADAVLFNRFQPGGRGLADWRQLTPDPVQLRRAAVQLAELGRRASVALGTPFPPCEQQSGSGPPPVRCPIGTRNAYPCVGPDGTLRPCNHWPVDGGDLLQTPLDQLLRAPLFRAPSAGPPAECGGCGELSSCMGGCPAARALAGQPIYHTARDVRPVR